MGLWQHFGAVALDLRIDIAREIIVNKKKLATAKAITATGRHVHAGSAMIISQNSTKIVILASNGGDRPPVTTTRLRTQISAATFRA